jgi:hypothetical protein
MMMLAATFRSFAGMTRIRFEGSQRCQLPGDPHLSPLAGLPSEQ